MKSLLLILRFIFGFLSVIFCLGLLRTLYIYFTNGGEIGMVNANLIWQFVFYLVGAVALTAIFNNAYDRRGFNDDRVIRKEDLSR